MDYQTILSETRDSVCLLTMNTPQNLNALSDVTITELHSELDRLEKDDNVRVVIVTGAGKAFVAGADIAHMKDLSVEQARKFSADTNAVYEKIRHSRMVFIAAVNGYALGGGCEFAIACDLRLASEYARFGLPEVTLGILPGAGGTQRLTRLVGQQRTMELVLSGDPIKAAEALAIGLVSRVLPAAELLPAAYELAARITKNPPLAVYYAKQCIRQSDESSLSAGLAYENAMFSLCFDTADQKEGMAAFLEKRPPKYQSGF